MPKTANVNFREQGCKGWCVSERATEWRQNKRERRREEKVNDKVKVAEWAREWTSERVCSSLNEEEAKWSRSWSAPHPHASVADVIWQGNNSSAADSPTAVYPSIPSTDSTLKEGLTCQIKVMLSSEEMGSIVSDIIAVELDAVWCSDGCSGEVFPFVRL